MATSADIPVFVEKADVMDANSAHYDEVLTDMSWHLAQEKDGFIAGSIFNHIPTKDKSAVYVAYDRRHSLRSGFAERAEGTTSNEIRWGAKINKTYVCAVYSASIVIGRQLTANVTGPINPERDAMEVLVDQSLIFKDEMWCAAFFKEGVWGLDLDGVAYDDLVDEETEFVYFDDYQNSDPIYVMTIQRALFRQRTGKEVNKIVMGRFVYDALLLHPKILKRVIGGFSNSGADPAKANRKTLASLFEVEEIVVANGIHDTGTSEDEDDLEPTFIAGSHMLMCHSPPRTNLKAPMAGGHFCWTGYSPGANDMGVTIDKWEDRGKKVWIMEMEMAFGLNVIAPILGVFFKNAVARS